MVRFNLRRFEVILIVVVICALVLSLTGSRLSSSDLGGLLSLLELLTGARR